MGSITVKPHAIVVASPGVGHLTPVLELVKRLVTHHGFEVTLFVVTSGTSSIQSQLLSSTSTIPNTEFLHIHVMRIDVAPHVAPEAEVVERLAVTIDKAVPLVGSAIACMKVCPDLLIADLFGTGFWAVADEFRMCKYIFMTTNAWFLALSVYLPVFEAEVGRDVLEGLDCIPIPGCNPVTRIAHLTPFTCHTFEHIWFVGVGRKLAMSDGIILNSWLDLEPKTIRSLNNNHLLGKLFPVGPLVKQPSLGYDSAAPSTALQRWMDEQPDESVLYVSFGSGGTLACEQIQELAWGLEFSQQRFIWVLRPPLDRDVAEFFLSVDMGGEHIALQEYLPTGFSARTKNIGLVVPMWAPQAEVLGHKSVGGFLTHCGWNSVVESVVNGVPMVAWPLYAEQGMNAAMLVEELEIAVRPEGTQGKVIGREAIQKAIRKIMGGEGSNAIRERLKKLQATATARSGEAGGGSSENSLSEFTKLVMRRKIEAHSENGE